ncbi:MAG: hypothetical protein E7404_02905 [Ruminococcaceae bacterium]|nr:hypothetical protein [Oscillospiraceae bacterium]
MKETFTYETQNNYSYKGFVDDTYRFIEDFQLMRPEIWSRFVQQFREAADRDGGWRGEFWGKMMRGACMTYDLKLALYNKQTNEKILLCSAEQVSEFDVFKYKIPKVNVDDFEIMLSCYVYYGENYLFDKSIVIGSDFDEFKKSGLLIYFQEADGMYVNVVTANQHDTYKLMEDSEDMWNLRDEPNQVYAEG